MAANLAHVLVGKGEYDEADLLAHEAEEIIGDEGGDVVTEVGWRTARARIVAARRDHDAAETLAREAIELATQTEYFETIADAYLALGEILHLAGHSAAGVEAVKKALRLYESKGFAVTAKAVRARRARVLDRKRRPRGRRPPRGAHRAQVRG